MSTGGSHKRIVHFPSATNFIKTQLTLFTNCNITNSINTMLKTLKY